MKQNPLENTAEYPRALPAIGFAAIIVSDGIFLGEGNAVTIARNRGVREAFDFSKMNFLPRL